MKEQQYDHIQVFPPFNIADRELLKKDPAAYKKNYKEEIRERLVQYLTENEGWKNYLETNIDQIKLESIANLYQVNTRVAYWRVEQEYFNKEVTLLEKNDKVLFPIFYKGVLCVKDEDNNRYRIYVKNLDQTAIYEWKKYEKKSIIGQFCKVFMPGKTHTYSEVNIIYGVEW